jgi:hypothetical protein
MASARVCDQCKQVEVDHQRWLMIADPQEQAHDSFLSAAGLFGFTRRDFCSWRCVADYALLKALDPEHTT